MRLALYRKYRPKTFEDFLGQETNVFLLKNAAQQGRLAHAYLFYGPRGTGKTSAARLIARLANCEKREPGSVFTKQGEPCNACTTCKEISAGSSLDVIEIDAASNRGIDEMRNLKESIRTAPAGSRSKVYIIDEAHMLTSAAWNALLKTLEEPPAHGILILATTEYEKVPPTITSRTQRFLFKKPPRAVIIQKLAAIAKEEGIAVERPALELIAAASEGSFRDAESLLDQIHTLEEHMTLEAVERITGRVGLRKVEELASLILRNNLEGALKVLGETHEEGHNLVQLTKDLIHYLRKVLALRMSPDLTKTLQGELTEDEIKKAQQLGEYIDPEKHVRLLHALIQAYSEMRYSPFLMVPLELALVEQLREQR